MKLQTGKFIDPLTDFGFKKLLGQQEGKPFLIDLLNSVFLNIEEQITDLKYLNKEQLDQEGDRKSIFDLYCQSDKGQIFVIELQNSKQDNFFERMLYYSTFPVRSQAVKGFTYNYQLKPVFNIAIVNFRLPESEEKLYPIVRKAKLTELNTGKIYYDKLTFFLLDLRKFDQCQKVLESKRDKWIFLLKNLGKLKKIPKNFKEPIFMNLFEKAELARLNEQAYWAYVAEIKETRDRYNQEQYIRREALAEGERNNKMQIAKNLLKMGLEPEKIVTATGLSLKSVKELANNLLPL